MSRRAVTDVCIGFELLRFMEHDVPPKINKQMVSGKKKAAKLLMKQIAIEHASDPRHLFKWAGNTLEERIAKLQ